MNLYVWSKDNFPEFDNFYGESMLCVVALDAQNAIKQVKDHCAENLDLWHLIQGTHKQDKELGTWSYPTHPLHKYYLEDRSLRSRGGMGTITRGNAAVAKLNIDDSKRTWHQWLLDNYIDPTTGYGLFATVPQEFDLTTELLLLSRASD